MRQRGSEGSFCLSVLKPYLQWSILFLKMQSTEEHQSHQWSTQLKDTVWLEPLLKWHLCHWRVLFSAVSPSSVQTKALFYLESLWQQNGENNKVSLMCIAHNICFIIWWSKLISWPADRICLIKRGKKCVEGSFLNLCTFFFVLQGIAVQIPAPHSLCVTFTWNNPGCHKPRTSEILLLLCFLDIVCIFKCFLENTVDGDTHFNYLLLKRPQPFKKIQIRKKVNPKVSFP